MGGRRLLHATSFSNKRVEKERTEKTGRILGAGAGAKAMRMRCGSCSAASVLKVRFGVYDPFLVLCSSYAFSVAEQEGDAAAVAKMQVRERLVLLVGTE